MGGGGEGEGLGAGGGEGEGFGDGEEFGGGDGPDGGGAEEPGCGCSPSAVDPPSSAGSGEGRLVIDTFAGSRMGVLEVDVCPSGTGEWPPPAIVVSFSALRRPGVPPPSPVSSRELDTITTAMPRRLKGDRGAAPPWGGCPYTGTTKTSVLFGRNLSPFTPPRPPPGMLPGCLARRRLPRAHRPSRPRWGLIGPDRLGQRVVAGKTVCLAGALPGYGSGSFQLDRA